MSFQVPISSQKYAATRFISRVRRELQRAYADESRENGVTASEIARRLNKDRSVVHRQISGEMNLTLRSVAEILHALNYVPHFEARKPQEVGRGQNFQVKAVIGGETTLPTPRSNTSKVSVE